MDKVNKLMSDDVIFSEMELENMAEMEINTIKKDSFENGVEKNTIDTILFIRIKLI